MCPQVRSNESHLSMSRLTALLLAIVIFVFGLWLGYAADKLGRVPTSPTPIIETVVQEIEVVKEVPVIQEVEVEVVEVAKSKSKSSRKFRSFKRSKSFVKLRLLNRSTTRPNLRRVRGRF